MKKSVLIPLIILAVILIAVIILYTSLVSSKTIKAQLNVEQGAVTINGIAVSGHTILKQGDIIETSANGLATVILYESVVVNIDSNTKITLDELTQKNPSITQEGGSTWSQFTNLFGVESYTINAGNSIASVRGTGFGIEENKIIVGEGQVQYSIDNQEFNVMAGKAVEKISEEILERDLTPEEQAKVKASNQRVIEQLKKLRELELEKHPKIVNIVSSKYDLSQEDITQAFKDADEGKINLKDFEDKSPVNIESLEKIIQITDKIRELNSRV